MFSIVACSQGYTMTGYGSITHHFTFDKFENGRLHFKGEKYFFPLTPDEFLSRFNSTYMNEDRYFLTLNDNDLTDEQVVELVKGFKNEQ